MSNQPQTVSELFPSKWLHAADLGTGKIVTISAQRIELMKPFRGETKEPKLVLSFKGARKELIVTKSQATALAEITGTEAFGQWAGTKVSLLPERLATGKFTILIKPAPNGQPPAQPAVMTVTDLYAAEAQPEAEAEQEPAFDF